MILCTQHPSDSAVDKLSSVQWQYAAKIYQILEEANHFIIIVKGSQVSTSRSDGSRWKLIRVFGGEALSILSPFDPC